MKNENSVKISFWSKLLYYCTAVVLWIASKIVLGFKLTTDKKVREWKRSKKSFVLLSAHPSEVDAIVMLFACFPRYARFVVAAQQLYKGLQGKGLRALQVIPKKQFIPDVKAIKEMMRTVKSGLILGMMPEGRVSMDSTENPMEDSTAKLLKKLGVPVAVLIPSGTYFVKPPYKYKGVTVGKIGGELKALFDEEEIKALSNEEVMERLREALRYNVSEELRGSGYKYGSRSKPAMENVSKLFYRCPRCGKLYTVSDKDGRLSCDGCGMTMELTREMFFIPEDESLPDNIAAWNKTQLEFEHEYWKDPQAKFVSKTKKSMMELGKDVDFSFVENCDGVLTLDAQGMHYEDPYETINVPLSILPGVSGDYENSFICFYQEDYIRRFYLEDPRMVARFLNSLMVLKGLK